MAWALSTANHSDSPLLAALARMCDLRVDEFKVLELSNTAWAFATTGWSDAPLFVALARTIEERLNEPIGRSLTAGPWNAPLSAPARAVERVWDVQILANTAWAFAIVGRHDAPLFAALAIMSELRVEAFNVQELANTAWAVAAAAYSSAPLFTALACAIETRVYEFNAQGLVNIAWAFAKRGFSDPPLFAALAKAAEYSVNDFNAQQLANTAWAFAKVGHLDSPLFATMAWAAEIRIDEFTAQGLVNMAWAFATTGQSNSPLFVALAKAVDRRINELTDQSLGVMAWSFAVVNFYSDLIFGPEFVRRCEAALWLGPEGHTGLCRLHQWVLWHQELGLPAPLSPALRDRCLAAFRAIPGSSIPKGTGLAATLTELGARTNENVKLKEGYRISAIVKWEEQRLALDFDGPHRFLRTRGSLWTAVPYSSAKGSTLLKRRQLRALGWRLITVPYWEWNAVKDNKAERLQYLMRQLQSQSPGS